MARDEFKLAELVGAFAKEQELSGSINLGGIIKLTAKQSKQRLDADFIANDLRAAINSASTRIAVDLKAALDSAMKSWPGGSIVDSGELLASGSVTVTPEGLTISYDAPYAALVHFGGYIVPFGNESASRVYLPPRPWVESVINGGGPVPQFDFVSYYEQAIRDRFR